MICKILFIISGLILSINLWSQDISKSLLIRDVSVVDYLFKFDETLTKLTSQKQRFIKNWLSEWDLHDLNKYPIDSRDTKSLQDLWPRTSNGNYDFVNSPFRLLAVVNRMDLVSK